MPFQDWPRFATDDARHPRSAIAFLVTCPELAHGGAIDRELTIHAKRHRRLRIEIRRQRECRETGVREELLNGTDCGITGRRGTGLDESPKRLVLIWLSLRRRIGRDVSKCVRCLIDQ